MDLKEHIRAIVDFPKPGILFYDISTLLAHPAILGGLWGPGFARGGVDWKVSDTLILHWLLDLEPAVPK